MKPLKVVTVLASLALAVPAFAQGAEKKEPAKPAAAAAPAKPAEPPKMEKPKPPAEMEAMKKWMEGAWKCDGKVGPEGSQMPSKGIMRWSMDLDGFWAVGKFTAFKSKESPFEFKSVTYMTYDAGSKTFVRTDVDNMGGWAHLSGKAEGDKQEWSGDGMGPMGKSAVKETITKKSDKEVAVNGSMGNFRWDLTCKK